MIQEVSASVVILITLHFLHTTLPKSREDFHITISNMTIETSKSENFLQVNNLDNGIIIFTCRLNLECLCSVDEIFMGGTFRCCPTSKTIHNSFFKINMYNRRSKG
jgi:hypothetical protein